MTLYRLSILCGFLFFWSIAVLAQDSVYFSYPLYFEDALGNKDTVYAALIERYPDINDRPLTQLGEEKIEAPFDSVFEVRMYWDNANVSENDRYFTQLLVQGSEGDPGKGISLDYKAFIHAKYPPVTVSYSISELEKHGLIGSYFTRDLMQFILPSPNFVADFTCAVEAGGSFEVNLNDTMPLLNSPLRDSFSVEGRNTLVSMPGIMFQFGHVQDCQYVNARAVELRQELFIYPNIADDQLNIRLPAAFPVKGDVRMISLDGRIWENKIKVAAENQNINISHLPPGQYYLIVQTEKRNYIGKFIKM